MEAVFQHFVLLTILLTLFFYNAGAIHKGLLLARPTDINACLVSILKGEDSGNAGSIDRAASDKYAIDNNLKEMFKNLMADVVRAREDDPVAYLIKKLSA